ncbi:MAG: cohesin domain-containing protein [Brevefilum sp.]
MRITRKFSLTLIFVSIILLVFTMPKSVFSQTDPPAAQLAIDPSISSALAYEPHQITIQVADVENLTAFELRVDFDPDVVQIVDVVNGGFLVEPDDPAFYSPDNNDGDWNTDGYIHFGLAQQSDSVTGELTPKSGTGDLIIITMQALAFNETTDFEIDESETELVWWGEDPDDPDGPVDGDLIPYTTADGVVNTVNFVIRFPIFLH